MRLAPIAGWVFAGLLLLAAVIAFFALRLTGAGAPASGYLSSVPYSIVVEGNGEASAAPDVAYVTLGVDTPAPTAAEATDTNAKAMAAVIAAVKAQGTADKDVRTQDFSVTPVYANLRPGDTSSPTITGYRVRNTVQVTVQNVQDVGKILDAGLQARANSAVGISFALKDSTALQQQALKDAMRQAQSKAEAIAASAGLKLTGPYTITESSTQPPRPITLAQPAAPAVGAATPIESGQMTVDGHVQVTFQYTH